MGRYTLVVLHKTDDSFGYYDVAGAKQIARVQTRAFPHEICLSPDRTRMYIAEMGVRGVETEGPGGHTVAVYDTSSRDLLGTIDTGPYDRPHGVATHANGRLFVTSESTRHLLIYDLETHRLLHAVPLDQECAHMVGVAPDGATAYTANIGSNTITAVDTQRGTVLRHIAVLERPEGMAFSPDGAFIYVVNRESKAVSVVDAARGEAVDAIETGDGPVRVAITPDGGRLAVPLFHSDAVQIADTTTRRVTHTIDVGRRPAGTAMSRDGTLVFMSCEEESAVYVLSMDTTEIVGRIPTGPGCDAMVCLDNGKDT
ncbi:MAG: beta-propeller fold lactonase family protein [Chitinivibrionales bacterium]|nr:beta-propeller fold lactonase family protein [Chitinivibrionales bacterium]